MAFPMGFPCKRMALPHGEELLGRGFGKNCCWRQSAVFHIFFKKWPLELSEVSIVGFCDSMCFKVLQVKVRINMHVFVGCDLEMFCNKDI